MSPSNGEVITTSGSLKLYSLQPPLSTGSSEPPVPDRMIASRHTSASPTPSKDRAVKV